MLIPQRTPVVPDYGLDDAGISVLRQRYGYNELPAPHENLLMVYLGNLWGPLPWLMELLIAITFCSGEVPEGIIIAALLLVNGGVSIWLRHSADAALAALTKRLSVVARVKRDGIWRSLPTRELLPGDVIRVRTGDLVPADAEIIAGDLSIDLSSLTGESLPQETGLRQLLFSGSVIRRGEATARVTAIGKATRYGKTTELLETAHPPTHMEQIIFAVIRYVFFFNIVLAATIAVFGLANHIRLSLIADVVIVLLLGSVPIAFPTMFAVAQSYGALQLSRGNKNSVLVRRLAAVQECAAMDVLCSDKTGTLTQDRMEISEITHYGTAGENYVLALAAGCADAADNDTIDEAILQRARERSVTIPEQKSFLPFNPVTKRDEADVVINGATVHVLSGLPELLLADDVRNGDQAKQDLVRLGQNGLRVLSIVTEDHGTRECVGLIGMADPVLPDAPRMIQELKALGVRMIMITGDGRATAHAVAMRLGLGGTVMTPADMKIDPAAAVDVSVFAETYPEDKLAIIRALQRAGHTVGMTGDGVNDAPALRQAEVGIAVQGATDVAKQSASFILTGTGLEGIIRAVEVSRGVNTRLRTWITNKVVKSFEISIFTTVIFLISRSYILSPLFAVLLIFANDFVTISIATDNTEPVPYPARWDIGRLVGGSAIIATIPLLMVGSVYLFARMHGDPIDAMRTIVYVALVFLGIATLYAIRVWPHGWNARPSRALVVATCFSVLFTLAVVCSGILTPPLSRGLLLVITAAAIISFFIVEAVKTAPMVRRLLML